MVCAGKIKYFNEKICRYFVLYKNKSSDLIDISDIDEVEMVLIQSFYRHFNYFYCKYSFVYLDLSSFVFIFKKKKLSSFTKPSNVLSMLLNFEPLKPDVLIWFVLLQKKRVKFHETCSAGF